MKKELNFSELLNEAITKPGKLLEAYKAFYNYSLGNRLLAMSQCISKGIEISPLATFNQWKAKDRHIKKGSKAIYLCLPVTKSYKKTNNDTGEEEVIKYNSFTYKNYWFSLSQTEGKQVNVEDISINWCKDKALTELNIKEIHFTTLNGNCQGYSTFENEIAINPLAQLPLKTLFHELAHIVLGHTSKEVLTDNEDLSRNIIEVEAEATALLCLESLGMEGSEYCRGYIQNWLKDDKLSDKNAQRIISAADKILKAGI
ncbi:MAG: ArdC-like ssDNA-binding domain-containing protein [Candidatus Gastranaerophilales bacterium]|nr:ArdC-like ssDNA-binding domain-containing protein [Candidatus Gastranaerophilales bacterium]